VAPTLPLVPFFHLSFFHFYAAHRDLHSFPTRRSSDLITQRVAGGPAPVRNRIFVQPCELGRRLVVQLARGAAQACRAPVVLRARSEEHTSELQSLTNLVCRLLLEKKKTKHPRSCTSLH